MRRISKSLKPFLFALGAVAGVLVLAALAVLAFVDVESYKPRVESAASDALGMEVAVEGPVRVGFFPGLHVALGNVRVRNRGSQLAFVETVELAIEVLPLLRRELRYSSITLNRARITVERGLDRRYNFQRPLGVVVAFHALELKRVSFPELVFVYADKASGSGFESSNCDGELTNMRHPGGAPFLTRLSLSGQFACGELRGKETVVSDFKLPIEATDGVFDFKPVTMRAFGGQGSGTLRVDRSVAVPVLNLHYSLSKFRIEDYFKRLPPGKSVSGLMDFSTTLSMRGLTRVELRRSAMGEMSLSGTNLTLAGTDLDQRFSKYEASQNFNLLDMTAFLLAGPIGLVATKGYDYSNLVQQTGGATQIRTVVSKWKVERGVAHATDVAMTTGENRLALQGGLDFVNDEYDEVFVAVIDSNGCARIRQRIRGPFSRPVVEKPDASTVVTGPIVNLFSKATGTEAKCEVFYRGSMAPPK